MSLSADIGRTRQRLKGPLPDTGRVDLPAVRGMTNAGREGRMEDRQCSGGHLRAAGEERCAVGGISSSEENGPSISAQKEG